MITLQTLQELQTLDQTALKIANTIAFNHKKGYSPTPDNITYWQYASHIEKQINQTKHQLNQQTFKFGPTLKITKKMKSGKIRLLYLSSWKDKLVEKWINNTLNIQLNNWYSKHSYAYRIDNFGLDNCQTKIAKAIQSSQYFIKRDITQYFYTINHQILLTKLATIINPNDYLYKLIKQRIEYQYIDIDQTIKTATIGIPFGSAMACTLANIYLTELDHKLEQQPINYFRYADDFLITAKTPEQALQAAQILDNTITDLQLTMKPSHKQNLTFSEHPEFQTVTKFKHLGIEFTKTQTRLGVEKQRKIINLFKKSLKGYKTKIQKASTIDKKLDLIIPTINQVIDDRIRSASIIDYYLKHINDEQQLKQLDMLITQLVISQTLNKKFRFKDFQKIPYKKLRQKGLKSLLHRNRLLTHDKIKVNFLSILNKKIIDRYTEALDRKMNRINQIKIAKKIAKLQQK